MKMARAFIASIPLAVALVAAVVVPITLTPSTFGFHRWPSDRAHGIPDRPVRVAPERIAEAPVRAPRPAASPARLVASAPVAAAPPRPVAATSVSTPIRTGGGSPQPPAGQPHAAPPPRGDRPPEPAPVDPPSPAPQPAPQDPAQSAADQPAPTVLATVEVPAFRATPHAPVTIGSCAGGDVEQPAPSR
jgi:hypothetical protein